MCGWTAPWTAKWLCASFFEKTGITNGAGSENISRMASNSCGSKGTIAKMAALTRAARGAMTANRTSTTRIAGPTAALVETLSYPMENRISTAVGPAMKAAVSWMSGPANVWSSADAAPVTLNSSPASSATMPGLRNARVTVAAGPILSPASASRKETKTPKTNSSCPMSNTARFETCAPPTNSV